MKKKAISFLVLCAALACLCACGAKSGETAGAAGAAAGSAGAVSDAADAAEEDEERPEEPYQFVPADGSESLRYTLNEDGTFVMEQKMPNGQVAMTEGSWQQQDGLFVVNEEIFGGVGDQYVAAVGSTNPANQSGAVTLANGSSPDDAVFELYNPVIDRKTEFHFEKDRLSVSANGGEPQVQKAEIRPMSDDIYLIRLEDGTMYAADFKAGILHRNLFASNREAGVYDPDALLKLLGK